jgi:hypothetical protein
VWWSSISVLRKHWYVSAHHAFFIHSAFELGEISFCLPNYILRSRAYAIELWWTGESLNGCDLIWPIKDLFTNGNSRFVKGSARDHTRLIIKQGQGLEWELSDYTFNMTGHLNRLLKLISQLWLTLLNTANLLL